MASLARWFNEVDIKLNEDIPLSSYYGIDRWVWHPSKGVLSCFVVVS